MTATSAVIDATGTYRYHLGRQWNPLFPKRCCFIMLNPSTADAEIDDPTIRRCIGFAKAWGFGALDVVNLFAYRATDPKELFLLAAGQAIGPDNDRWIRTVTGSAGCQLVVAAWGAHRMAGHRGSKVTDLIDRSMVCLGRTKDGYPRHPLYVPAAIEREPFG
jgi:hypothetical protein